MKEFVGVTQEENHCPTEPSLKDIGGRACRRKPKNMPRSVINAKKDMVQIHQVRVGPSWMDPIVTFLKDDILPEEKSEAEKI